MLYSDATNELNPMKAVNLISVTTVDQSVSLFGESLFTPCLGLTFSETKPVSQKYTNKADNDGLSE